MSEHSPCRLVLLPGLGADARLFEPQRREFPDIETPAWLEPGRRESLTSYARRMSEGLQRAGGDGEGSGGGGAPLVLGGVSFGGMVALEMARNVSPACVVLIGSAASGAEMRFVWRVLERATRPLRGAAVGAVRPLSPLAVPLFGRLDRAQRRLFLDMLHATPTSFLRWAVPAIMAWRPEAPGSVPVHRIHGSRDRFITPPRDGSVIAPGAGHLVNLTHAERVNGFLRRVVNDVGQRRS